jgi:hypothetical protein
MYRNKKHGIHRQYTCNTQRPEYLHIKRTATFSNKLNDVIPGKTLTEVKERIARKSAVNT